jgi:hypothetical protein
MLTGSMPSITPVQIKAALAFVIAQAVAFGWLDTHRSQLLLSIGGTVIAAVWPLADAYLRAQRAKAVALNPAAFPGAPVPPAPPVNP